MGARIINLMGGPPTLGHAPVATLEKVNTMRAQMDLEKGDFQAEMFNNARKFYDEFLKRCVQNKTTVDVFGFSLDQFGMAEMKYIVENTGGFSIIQEEFKQQVFQDSIKKYFEADEDGNLRVASGGILEMFPSKPIKIKGALGCCET